MFSWCGWTIIESTSFPPNIFAIINSDVVNICVHEPLGITQKAHKIIKPWVCIAKLSLQNNCAHLDRP